MHHVYCGVWGEFPRTKYPVRQNIHELKYPTDIGQKIDNNSNSIILRINKIQNSETRRLVL